MAGSANIAPTPAAAAAEASTDVEEQKDLIMNELGLSGKDLSKMQSFLKFIITNQETPSALNENIATLIEKKLAYTKTITEIIDATKNDIARLSGAVLNSALDIPLDLVKLKCIQETLDKIQDKLAGMPVEALYKVYTSSFPAAIAIAGAKTQIDNAINDFLNDQCTVNIPKLTAVIDTAYDVAKKASAAIDRLAGETNEKTTGEDNANRGLGASSSMQTHSTAMMTPPPTLISIYVTHGKTTHKLESLDAASMTVGELKAELHSLTNVPADMMRLILRGKTLTTGTLLANKLTQGAKLLLMGNPAAAVAAANSRPHGDGGKGLDNGNLATEKHEKPKKPNIRSILNGTATDISNPTFSTESNIGKRSVVAVRGGAKSYMRKPHRRRTRHHKTQRRRTRRHKTQRRRTRHHKTHRNKKKPRRRTIRRKKRHKRRTR
jgi:hypothetical protein